MDWKGFFFFKALCQGLLFWRGDGGGLLFRIEATLGNKLVLSVRSPLPPLSGLIMFLKGKKKWTEKNGGGTATENSDPSLKTT